MRKVIVSEFLSLDGVMEDPKWTLPYWNDEIARFKKGELFAADALLLGRVTYEGFAAAWPSQTDEEGYADRMNGIPKHVVSNTLDSVEWNNSRLVKKNIKEVVTHLKEEPGQDMLIFGSGMLVQTLRRYGLIDQFNLLIYPVILGSGKRLFPDGSDASLNLVDTRSLGSGVVLLQYQVEQNEE